MNHGPLLRHCVEVLDTFNSDMQSVEEHVNQYLKENGVMDEGEQTFIVEVFSGCVRYTNVTRVVLEGFYAEDGKRTLRSEQNLYAVLAYLALFRLDELGLSHFRQFVRSQDVNRMYRFLNFFLKEDVLQGWMKNEWERYYDRSFVQTMLISPITVWLPELQEMLQQMKEVIDNRLRPKKKSLTVTEPEPFNITKPRPRSVPVPQQVPKLKVHKQPPQTLYKEPSEMDKIKQIRQTNRRQAEERLMDASKKQFACANPEKSDKTKAKVGAIIAYEEGKLDFNRHTANVAPSFLLTPKSSQAGSARRGQQDMPIKMTTAAILREGHLYQKREDKEIKRLESLEAGAKDKTEFEKWQGEMKKKDLDAKLADIERRRLEGKLSHEEAILARQQIIKENKQRVMEMKEETKKMMEEYLQQRLKEEQDMKLLVEDTMKGHKNAKETKKKLQEYKQKIVQEVAEESRELMRQALEEAEKEMRKKMELIHQIRAMEAVPVIRQKFVDLTATSGAGLLGEMSITELRERLSLLRTAEKEKEETKRDDILYMKEAKDQKLLDTLEVISKHRLEQTKANAIKLEARKRGEPKTKGKIQTEELTDLQKRLEEKRKLRHQEQQSARIAADRKSTQRTRSLISQKKNLEENRWRELEATRERSAQIIQQAYTKSASRLTSTVGGM